MYIPQKEDGANKQFPVITSACATPDLIASPTVSTCNDSNAGGTHKSDDLKRVVSLLGSFGFPYFSRLEVRLATRAAQQGQC